MEKTFTLTEDEINTCIHALRCLDSEWGLDNLEEELLIKLELTLED